ncbi:uncharacterized protein LOC111257127 [Setaria italica]|uniref:uncharacterized protein LOC111257127 n=1 Tax=Setaria italica TaxID=4555 RepID=UPI000BE612B2|nr:uncharacterized protein LOC111257127 [Setaria italica]
MEEPRGHTMMLLRRCATSAPSRSAAGHQSGGRGAGGGGVGRGWPEAPAKLSRSSRRHLLLPGYPPSMMQIKLERGRCERPPPPSVRTHITTLSSLSCSLSKACCGATAGGGDGFAAISLLHPPLPTATPAAAGPGAQEPLNSRVDGSSNNNSRSFCVEIGSVSNRRSSAAGDDLRTYSLGSFDYRVDEEVQAVVSHITCPAVSAAAAKSATPVEALAEAAGSSGWRADAAWRRRGPADAAGWRRRGGCGGDRRRHWRWELGRRRRGGERGEGARGNWSMGITFSPF